MSSSVFKVNSGIEMTSAKLTNDIVQYILFTLPSVIYEHLSMDIICNAFLCGPQRRKERYLNQYTTNMAFAPVL